ncbi:bacterial regulatory helix-turn-helix, lysR family protein [Paraburkholderia fungorum]|jgi:DNA-binding transcriptional LysR family regulator|uniref:Bacterial regulatory helix-turn-helix, lysR family protein n=1 Tax=Paraburkholderia fungorum TaxID=134537 RepID=A0AAP5QKN3_9BURK|nr:LysR substrate-binding domain-containing protein [Paraburkholderia fungorum]AJZ56822.1 bacterial regulatory helix-turn-helix, lysR family protein [Paraburkholderia fungorum]MBB4519964.1 DNA-binding transcriptional LysR family regulator [Paraburkholderia fungorum]MDT8844039.1 LysR substrate-binding domain-containing protein [Paraburkholderia fungorum]
MSIVNLDMELLRTFVAIVERESFAAAAESVHRTQSAVTQQMQRLETQTGRTLFRKHGREKRLTDDGLKLLEYARRMLTLNDEACSAIAGSSLTGEVRLGAPVDVADTILPNLLQRFSKSFPSLRMTIDVGRSPFLIEAMKAGELDMTLSPREQPELRRVTLRTSPTVWICAADYRYDRSQPLDLIIADEPSMFRRMALEHLERAGIAWRVTYVAPTLPGIRAAVRAGLGVTARSIEMMGPDFRVLGESDGLPRLPDVQYHLYLGSAPNLPARQLFDSLGSLRI